MNWRKYFERYAKKAGEQYTGFGDVEEMYQAFKDRMKAELVSDTFAGGWRRTGKLRDRNDA